MTPTRRKLVILAALTIIVSACGHSPETTYRRGVAHFKAQEFSKAATSFEQALANAQPTAQAFNFLGVCRLHEGRPDDAIQQFQNALKLDTSYTAAHYNLGVALLEQGKTDDAIPHLRQAAQTAGAPTDAQYQLGLAYLRAAAWAQARLCFEKVAETDKSPAPGNYLGIIDTRLGDFKQARQHFDQVIKTNPDYAPAYLNLAVLEHRHLGQKQAAVAHYQKYLDLLPKSQQREDVRLTIVQLNQESTLRPKPVEVAVTKPPEPKPVEVAAAPKPPPPPEPTPAPVVTPVATPVATPAPAPAPVFKRRAPVAATVLKAGNRTKAKSYFNDGVIQQQQGKLANAIGYYNKAVATDPSYAQAYYNLGVAYNAARQPARALDNYEWALTADPGFNDARFNYAILLQQEGYTTDALNQYEKILAQNPDDASVHLTVGTLYARDRETWPKARLHYEAYLKLAPNSPPARDIRRWLDLNR